MKFPGIWVYFFVVGAALVVFTFFCSSSIPGMEFLQHGDGTRVTGTTSRKLKEIGDSPSNGKQRNVDMDDYHPIDPVPSSKASIKPGPIEHGSPLIPYIPKPPPPDNPKIAGISNPIHDNFKYPIELSSISIITAADLFLNLQSSFSAEENSSCLTGEVNGGAVVEEPLISL
ncbi:hypothetical protein V6N11_003648 [Hibiscus sabdariffa]|uniref:Uncharacterized protein n=1 Tax=Hibiscus sabdariffa TaxID=183260 RepID=A0ABR2SE36_9ROSI